MNNLPEPSAWELWANVASVLEFIGVLAFIVLGWLWKTGRWVFKPKPQTEAPPPIPRIGALNLPHSRKVVGRAAELAELRAKLTQGGEVAITHALVSGHGGFGKSTLARHYAEAFGDHYHGILWVSAATRQALIDGIVTHLWGQYRQAAAPNPAGLADARALLDSVEEQGLPWLFIYDNVEELADISDLLPRNAHLIVTTRQGEGWSTWQKVKAGVLRFDAPDAPAVDLLIQEAVDPDARDRGLAQDRAGAQALAADLGGFPLALVVAGRLIRTQGGSFADYRTRLAEVVAHVPGGNEDYPTSLIGAVKLSYDALSADGRIIADLCAWWAAEGLGPELIHGAPTALLWEDYKNDCSAAVQNLAHDAARVRAGFQELVERSLITKAEIGFEMHRITALALRKLQTGKEQNGAAASLLASSYPGRDRSPVHSPQWPICARLTPHVTALWKTGQAPRSWAMGFLLNQACIYLHKMIDKAGTLELALGCLEVRQHTLAIDDVDLALAHGNLAGVLNSHEDFAGAEKYFGEAIMLCETYNSDSSHLSGFYNNRGGVYLGMARAGDASKFRMSVKERQKALCLRRRQIGRRSEPVAQALNNLGVVREEMGRLTAARNLYNVAWAIRSEVLSANDNRLAYSARSLGTIHLKLGRADLAEPLLVQARKIREATLSNFPQHEERRDAADWLITCLLVRAAAGENWGLREAEAKRLCAQYGFQFEDRKLLVKNYPYDPGGQG